ncbi:MAG: HAMP domain-containing sensor histidine kinase [Methylophilaceae bacterium]
MIALGSALHYIQQAERSLNAVAEAVVVTRQSRALVDQLNPMERSLRQYLVSKEDIYQKNYLLGHVKFNSAINALTALPRYPLGGVVEAISETENALTLTLTTQAPELIDAEQFISQFSDLVRQASDMLAENNRQIDLQSTMLTEAAEHMREMVLWQAIALIPAAFVVILVITFLIARPIRRMDAAINRLGEGQYTEPISIDGPGDLRSLGERLDWLRTQLEATDIQKQRFLRHVSHELKTPLTAIREASELLRDGIGGALSAQQIEIIGILRENSLRLQRMIENLLNYTAVKSQKPQLKIQEFSPAELVEETLANYALTLSGKQITIKRNFKPINLSKNTMASDAMLGDKEKIRTVIDNLLSNALKFTPQQGNIRISVYPGKDGAPPPPFEQRATTRISTQAQSRFVIIEVQDNGPGVTNVERDHLFNPFYTGSSDYESLVGGSGLGLSIAREYVHAHGGEITLLSPEHGAQFRVRLPLEQQMEPQNV